MMNEKALKKQDLEKIFVGFEKRQDKRFKGLEGGLDRVDSRMASVEGRLDHVD